MGEFGWLGWMARLGGYLFTYLVGKIGWSDNWKSQFVTSNWV